MGQKFWLSEYWNNGYSCCFLHIQKILALSIVLQPQPQKNQLYIQIGREKIRMASWDSQETARAIQYQAQTQFDHDTIPSISTEGKIHPVFNRNQSAR